MEQRTDTEGNVWFKDGDKWRKTSTTSPSPKDPDAKRGSVPEIPPIVAATIGTMRTFDKLQTGFGDLVDKAQEGMFGKDNDLPIIGNATQRREDTARQQSAYDQIFEKIQDSNPYSTMFGEVAPALASIPFTGGGGVAAQASHIAPKATNSILQLLKATGRESVLGGAEALVNYDGDLKEGLKWGAIGGFAGKYAGDFMGGTASKLNQADEKIIKWAAKRDLYLPPGMRTGDTKLQQMDGALETHQQTANKVTAANIASKQAENRIISKEMGGERADVFSDDYLSDQRNRIAGKMDELVEGSEITFSPEQAQTASDIIEKFKSTDIGQKSRAILDKAEERIMEFATGDSKVSGEQYQKLTAQLRKAAANQRKNINGDENLAESLEDLVSLYDDSLGNTLSGASALGWKKSRKEYALLNAVERTLENSTEKGAAGVSGYVDTAKLAKDFKASEDINMLGKVEKLRKAQAKSSLSTTGLVGRMFNAAEPMDALGSINLILSRSHVPLLDDIATGVYMKGYPHATGLAPIFGRKATQPTIERAVPRYLAPMQSKKDEEKR